MIDQMRETVADLEQDILAMARELGRPAAQVERGFHHMESGHRAAHSQDFSAGIAAYREAVRLLGDWPPLHNGLALALFHDGQAEQAVDVTRQVLARDPNNIFALSNAVRFLAWTGQEMEARGMAARLQDIEPQGSEDRFKMAEVAAILDEDERVYQLLKPLERSRELIEDVPFISMRVEWLLAVAEANTGRRGAARRLEALRNQVPWAAEFVAALKARRPGPGHARRFPYFHISEFLPPRYLEEFIDLFGGGDDLSPEEVQRRVADYARRFPQIVLMAEKLIWEEDQIDVGVAILESVDTPAAYVALRRFGLSQVGDDEVRMDVLLALSAAGQIAPDETVRVWREGAWRELQIHRQDLIQERAQPYSQEVADLLNDAQAVFQAGDRKKAELLFRRALELEPRAKEAYNNLGALHSYRGEHEQARQMYRAALEIDPYYVFPRCNLAIYALDDEDVEGARALIEPLAQLPSLVPHELAFYYYIKARIAVREEDYASARNLLETALQVVPGYHLAEKLLDQIKSIDELEVGWGRFWERYRQQNRARRARLQTRLTTPDPTLSEVLSLYSKEILTAVARVVLPWGGWSALRKAELLAEILTGLKYQSNLDRMASELSEQEQAALRQVLASGGTMPWADFEAHYGNDLEESPAWQYHKPETVMGRLRLHGLLAETTVGDRLLVVVPAELRQPLREIL
jgi:Flp pilus assembly protein TadD